MLGKTLNHYKVLEKLGAGGMGEVYLAEDTKLHRNVALKTLPAELASDERRQRFEREAQAVAALNHPNIVTVFSVEEAEDVHFITMELVKGKTLSELIPKKGMPLSKFFEIAIPLADAVSAAHEQGIIHRDLKPDNLMVGDDGRLKILDFGLAKLKPGHAEPGISELPTQSATAEGRILGTVAYMSPEQAEGKSIDHRSDIFSIGIILYEMATGERPFKGDSSASILSSVIKDTPPPVTELRPELPRDLEKLIRRCLVKDAEGRLQATKDLRNELRESKQDVDSGEAVAGKAVSKPKRTMWPLAVIGAALVGALVFFALDAIRHEAPAIAPSFERLTTAAGVEQAPSISPDGKAIVYVGRESPEDDEDIYYLRVGGQNPTNLTKDSPSNDGAPAFSPDGEKIAFISDRDGGGIFIMGATGESVRRLTDFGSRPAWSPDGSHVLVDTGGGGARSRTGPMSQIWRIDTNTGDKNLVFPGDAIDPYYSPSGTRIVYQAGHDIWTISAEGGEPVQVTQHETMDHQPVWSPDGRLLYFVSNRGGSSNLWRIPIDEQTGRVLGQPEPVTSGGGTPREHPSISADGSKIAYVERLSGWDLHRFSFDPVTAKTRDPLPLVQRKNAYWPDVSPDGEWIVFFEGFRQQQEDIGVIRNDGTAYRKLTDDIHRDRHPRWSPDGKIIAFDSERSGEWQVWTIRFDGSDLTQLTHGAEGNRYPVWSPDGAYLTYQDMANGDSVTIDVVEGAGENPLPNRLRFDEEDARFIAWSWSPDGARLAGWVRRGGRDAGIVTYSRDEGRFEQWTTVGRNPSWLSDGQTILIAGQSLVDGATKQVRELDKAGRHTILGTISPDDKYVYTSIRVMEADIWMLTLNEEQ